MTMRSMTVLRSLLFLRPCIRLVSLLWGCMVSRLHRVRLLRWEARTLGSMDLGPKSFFYVPVRVSGGAGPLNIGSGNIFGYWMTPRSGDGALLIQPKADFAVISIGNNNAFNNNVTHFMQMNRLLLVTTVELGME